MDSNAKRSPSGGGPAALFFIGTAYSVPLTSFFLSLPFWSAYLQHLLASDEKALVVEESWGGWTNFLVSKLGVVLPVAFLTPYCIATLAQPKTIRSGTGVPLPAAVLAVLMLALPQLALPVLILFQMDGLSSSAFAWEATAVAAIWGLASSAFEWGLDVLVVRGHAPGQSRRPSRIGHSCGGVLVAAAVAGLALLRHRVVVPHETPELLWLAAVTSASAILLLVCLILYTVLACIVPPPSDDAAAGASQLHQPLLGSCAAAAMPAPVPLRVGTWLALSPAGAAGTTRQDEGPPVHVSWTVDSREQEAGLTTPASPRDAMLGNAHLAGQQASKSGTVEVTAADIEAAISSHPLFIAGSIASSMYTMADAQDEAEDQVQSMAEAAPEEAPLLQDDAGAVLDGPGTAAGNGVRHSVTTVAAAAAARHRGPGAGPGVQLLVALCFFFVSFGVALLLSGMTTLVRLLGHAPKDPGFLSGVVLADLAVLGGGFLGRIRAPCGSCCSGAAWLGMVYRGVLAFVVQIVLILVVLVLLLGRTDIAPHLGPILQPTPAAALAAAAVAGALLVAAAAATTAFALTPAHHASSTPRVPASFLSAVGAVGAAAGSWLVFGTACLPDNWNHW